MLHVLGLVFAGMHDMKRKNVKEKRIGEPILKVSFIIKALKNNSHMIAISTSI